MFLMIKHIVRAQDFDEGFLMDLFSEADEMRRLIKSGNRSTLRKTLEGNIMATLFYEPSTRTRMSFEAAMYRLGGNVISTENASEFSSAVKGETLEDTIRVVSGYVDVIVIRHYDDEVDKGAVDISRVPIINAGSGQGQHPTQTLLDLYTINDILGGLQGIKIAMVGDLKRGRTVKSLSYVLGGKFNGTEIYFVSPENSKMSDNIKDYLNRKKVKWEETSNLNEVLPLVDCVYMTRIQKERFDNEEEYNKAKGQFVMDNSNIGFMKDNAILLHPLPKINEINPEINTNKRSKYFEQAENGLYVRMALLKHVLS